jgi:hypothetical protein
VPDVPDVHQVEAPVAVDDLEAASPRRLQAPGEVVERQDLGDGHRVVRGQFAYIDFQSPAPSKAAAAR